MAKIEPGKKALGSRTNGEDIAEEAGCEVVDGADGSKWLSGRS
jgi:hypothetical protein